MPTVTQPQRAQSVQPCRVLMLLQSGWHHGAERHQIRTKTADGCRRWCAGKRQPRPEMALKIVEATGGRVSLESLYV